MEKLIPIRVVEDHTGLKKSSLYKRIRKGTFPSPVKLGTASRWLRSEVDDWISRQITHAGKQVHLSAPALPSEGGQFDAEC